MGECLSIGQSSFTVPWSVNWLISRTLEGSPKTKLEIYEKLLSLSDFDFGLFLDEQTNQYYIP